MRDDERPIIRACPQRLAASVWTAGRNIQDSDLAGRIAQVMDVQVEETEPPDHVAEILSADRVWRRSRTYEVDGRPVQHAVSYLPADLAAGTPITQPDTGPGGVYARLADLGHAPARFREDIRVEQATVDEQACLLLATGSSVIRITRVAYDADGRPVEVNEMVLRSHDYLLRYEFDVG